jgi:hypothetical protein
LATASGRITLTGDILKITKNGEVTEKELNNEEKVQQALLDHFKIKL